MNERMFVTSAGVRDSSLQADGTFGGLFPDAHAAEMAALLRDRVHIKLTGIGHSIHSTATEAMKRLVLPFLDSIE